MSPGSATLRIGGVLCKAPWGRFTLLHWKPRLVAIAAVLALVLIALGGLGIEVDYNLYW
jgi:hypothetical protein